MLVTMKEILDIASKENYGVAAPNIYSELDARAYIEAAEEMNSPLIIDFIYGANPDIDFIGSMVKKLANDSKVPVALNLDHCSKKKYAIAAIRAGFTSVMIDRSSKPFEDNAREVKEIVDIAHEVNVSVEAELGHVGSASQYADDRDAALTSPEEAVKYIEATGVDCLAVAIGTAHGAYPKGFTPYLDFDRLVEIKKATNNFPLVLHGSSGTKIEDLRKVCQLGINKINICNDLCRTAADTLQSADLQGGKAYDIYKIQRTAVKEKLKEMIEVYGSKDKAWKKEPTGILSGTKSMAE